MAETEPYVEYGILAPNGEIHWGSLLGHPLNTQDERTVMNLVLRKTAQEFLWPEEEFAGRYQWATRTVQVHDVYRAIDDPAVAPPIENGAPNGE